MRLLPGQSLEQRVTLNAGDRLRFAVGVPGDPQAGDQELEVRASLLGRDGTMVLDRAVKVRPGTRWRDREVLVSEEFAGPGRLKFEVFSDAPLEAAVADPRIVPPRGKGVSRPNLLVYVIDTLRADHLSCYGAERTTSPRIDRLAGEGYRFDSFYAVAPWTRPTMATLLTGAPPEQHGMGKLGPLPQALETLAEILARAGYSTWAAVANPQVGIPALGFEQGFHRFVTHEGVREEEDVLRGIATSEQLNRTILPWLEKVEGEPFLLYMHSLDPHSPYTPGPGASGPFGRSYQGPLRDKSLRTTMLRSVSEQLQDEDREYVKDAYDNEIVHQDAQFGKVLDALESRGLLEKTIVIVLSDHGEEFHEHGNWDHGYRMWEELLRVPLVVWIPERFRSEPGPAPRVIGEPVSQLDFLPGLLDLLDLAAPTDLPGRSWRPLLAGVRAAPNPLYAIDFQSWMGDEIGAYRYGRYKLQWCKGDGRTLAELLFDLEADPREQHDLVMSRPDLLERMRGLVARHQQELARFDTGVDSHREVELDEATLQELRELGYVDPGIDRR